MVTFMLKKQIEALLLAFPEGLAIEEICSHAKCSQSDALGILEDLDQEYNERSFDVVNVGNRWRIVLKPEVTHLVKNLAPSELTKSVQKTLAMIAYLNPARQSDVVRFRGNKSYEHIKELKEKEFVKTKQSGRTLKVWVTDKFYRYFDIKHGEEKYLFKKVEIKDKG